MNIHATDMIPARQVPVSQLFDIPAPDHVTLPVRARGAHSLPVDADYLFRKDQVQLAMAFFFGPRTGEGLYIHGPFGSGKTSFVRNFLGRVHYPTLMVDWNYESEVEMLIGSKGIAMGDTLFEEGPLTLAMREGFALLINEIDRGRPSNLTAFHGILDGAPLHVKETNEVIEPHPDFRLIVTANSGGSGDRTGTYTGSVRRMDPAFMDRFYVTECNYLDPAEEVEMMMQRFPDYDASFLEKIVKFAGETREKAADATEILSTPFSTRAMKRFLSLGMAWGIHEVPGKDMDASTLMRALRPAYAGRLDADEREAVTAVLKLVFGG